MHVKHGTIISFSDEQEFGAHSLCEYAWMASAFCVLCSNRATQGSSIVHVVAHAWERFGQYTSVGNTARVKVVTVAVRGLRTQKVAQKAHKLARTIGATLNCSVVRQT